MNIEEKNEGQKIGYTINNTIITFDNAISINLAKYQKDTENVIDVCLDENMQLTTGLGKWYVANIILPPKTYKDVDTGTKDSEGNEVYNRVADPLDINKVTLILWALPANYIGGVN